MRGIVYLLLHMAPLFALDASDCDEFRLITKQDYCDNSTATLSMHTTYSYNNLTEVRLEEGCDVESTIQVANNNTFYIDCETEYVCEEHKSDNTREIFIVQCESDLLSLVTEKVEVKKETEEDKKNLEAQTKKDLTVPILAGTSAAAVATVGSGFLIYKLKTLFQSGSFTVPA